jgi:hypothetical protein
MRLDVGIFDGLNEVWEEVEVFELILLKGEVFFLRKIKEVNKTIQRASIQKSQSSSYRR